MVWLSGFVAFFLNLCNFVVTKRTSEWESCAVGRANFRIYTVFMQTLGPSCEKYTQVQEGDGLQILANLLKKFSQRSPMAKLSIAMDLVSLQQKADEKLEDYHHRSHILHKRILEHQNRPHHLPEIGHAQLKFPCCQPSPSYWQQVSE